MEPNSRRRHDCSKVTWMGVMRVSYFRPCCLAASLSQVLLLQELFMVGGEEWPLVACNFVQWENNLLPEFERS